MIAPKLFNVQISSLIRCILVLIVHDIVILVIMLIRIVVVIIRMMIIIIILIITIIIIVIIITCVIILILNNYVGGNNHFKAMINVAITIIEKIYNDVINEINKRYFEIFRDALKSQNKVHISKA